jgi:hypothetical protein
MMPYFNRLWKRGNMGNMGKFKLHVDLTLAKVGVEGSNPFARSNSISVQHARDG